MSLELTLSGVTGPIEACLDLPKTQQQPYVALLGHPHSLQGGTMNNKVITTLARTFNFLGIPSLRFNFRGVQHSFGTYDGGIGESEDMILLAKKCLNDYPQAQLCFAGFSFGSYVAYRAAHALPHASLLLIAPPIDHYNYDLWVPDPQKTLIVQAEKDDIARPSVITPFAHRHQIPILSCPDADHFFHGQLTVLKTALIAHLQQALSLS